MMGPKTMQRSPILPSPVTSK